MTNGRIDIRPWQDSLKLMADYGLTAEDGMSRVWYIDQSHISGGAEAINDTMQLIWWAKPFAYLYRLPGIRHIQDWLYNWVSANRHRMPGGTAECKIEESFDL